MAHLIGSRALEIVGKVYKPCHDYDLIVSEDEFKSLVSHLRTFPKFSLTVGPNKAFLLKTDRHQVEATISHLKSHEWLNYNSNSMHSTVKLFDLDVNVASLPILWIYKRAPSEFPVQQLKTIKDLVHIGKQLKDALTQDQIQLKSLVRDETLIRNKKIINWAEETELQSMDILKHEYGRIDAFYNRVSKITGTKTQAFMLDHAHEIVDF